MAGSNLNGDQGFIRKPYAIQKLLRMPDGSINVIYVDAKTGKEVNPKGHTVIQNNDVQDVKETKPTKGQSVNDTQNTNPNTDAVMGNPGERDANPNIQAATSSKSSSGFGESYINKPGAMGFAGFLPGILGTAGMAANVGVNANNVKAVNDQRSVLGMDPNSTMANVKGLALDQKGYIGDVTTGPVNNQNTTPVGFEVQDKYGRTTFTPEEARMRAELAKTGTGTYAPATEAAKQNAITAAKETNPQPGFLSNLATGAKALFSGLFGPTPAEVAAAKASTNVPPGAIGGATMDKNSFPDAPTAPSDTSMPSGNGPHTADQSVADPAPGSHGLY